MPVDLAKASLKQLRLDREEVLFGFMLFFAFGAWLAIALTIIGLVYALFVGLVVLIARQLFLAHVQGNGVRVSAEQLPDVYERVVAASQRMGLKEAPAVYVMQSGGTLNAMATKLFSRNFMIIFSELIEACGEDKHALDFVIGHEMGHMALGHLKWQTWVAPARLIPLLGFAYSRACEYSCDRCGLAVVQDLEPASRGLAILAAGGKLGHRLSLPMLMRQAEDATRFWPAIYELSSTHPFLSKRMRALKEFVEPGTAPRLGRNIFAYPLAPILGLPAAGLGGSAMVGVLMLVLALGIVAAVVAPDFRKSLLQTKQAEARQLLNQCQIAQENYYASHGEYGTTFDQIGLRLEEPPNHYTLYMGENRLGEDQSLPTQQYRGYADRDKGYACVTVANLDADETLDVWVIDSTMDGPHHFMDDETHQITPPPQAEVEEEEDGDTDTNGKDADAGGKGAAADE